MTTNRIQFVVSDELKQCLDHAAEDRQRNALIERLLWGSRVVKQAAKQLGIDKPDRRGPGRPPTNAE